MYEFEMSLDNIYKRLNECNITDNGQREFVINNRNILPAHEIETVISYFSKGHDLNYVKRNLMPIMEHIKQTETETSFNEERE